MSAKKNHHRLFSHIYVEKAAESYPLTKTLLNRFKKAEKIEINNYAEIFNRNRQDFRAQKKAQKIILAVKKKDFLYPGSDFTPAFGAKNFFYNAMALNCIYDCEYCYLQGMFSSGNLVIFVNEEDFYQAAIDKVTELGDLYLSISYDTDLLAIEDLTDFSKKWLKICHQEKNLSIECRTKSVNISAILKETPADNFILAWTLSPEDFSKKYEKLTPNLTARIKAINQAINHGFKVRLCLDPVLPIKNWQNIYQEFFEFIYSEIDFSKLRDISIGSFRMNKGYFKQAKKLYPESHLYNFPYEIADNTVSTGKEQEIQIFFNALIKKHNLKIECEYI